MKSNFPLNLIICTFLLYADSKQNQTLQISVNGKPVTFSEELGYEVLNRQWKKGDIIELNTPMDVRRIASRP
ncbi:MAG TPA: hypothetical protein VF373_12990 [Prolixibacteraceae bacterium]